MRAAFFALAALPLYAIAQDIPTDASTTTTSETLELVAETSSEVSMDPTTTDPAIVVLESTSEATLEDPETTTDTELPIQDTTTEQPLAQETTTGLVPTIDTTQTFDVIQSAATTKGGVPQDTTAVAPASSSDVNTESFDTTIEKIPAENTTQEPIKDTTSGGTIVQDTTSDIPPAEKTEQQPVQETTTDPSATETTGQQPDPDTTNAATTTDQAPVQDTTTTAGKPDETTTQPGPGESKPQPTSDEVKDPVITAGPVFPSFTIPLPEATSSISSASSQVLALMPIIEQWKSNPDGLKEETNKRVEDTRNDIVGLIKSLGGDPSVGCGGRKIKARGLLDFITNAVSTLTCMAEGLGKVAGGVMAGNVPAVTGAATGVQSQNNELNDQKDDKKEDEKSEEKSDEKSTKQESTKQESSSERTTETPSTSTEQPTTTTEYIQPCASDTCQGACPMGPGPGKDGKMAIISAGPGDCKDIPTITTDVLPTKPTIIDAPTKKRDLSARAFLDNSSPNPNYVKSMRPAWLSQDGAASGHWYPFPMFGQGQAGVNGIYGCTAVIIVSIQGVYLSHIWENPVFINADWSPTPDDFFREKSFEALRDGATENGVVTAESITGLVGTDAQPGPLHAKNYPSIFVITPYTSPFDTGIATIYRYQDRAQQLLRDLTSVIPGSVISELVGYTRTDPSKSTDPDSVDGRAILEVDMFQYGMTLQNPNLPPEDSRRNVARWRLWVEAQLVQFQDFIDPLGFPGLYQKREENPNLECLLMGGSGKTSADATSSAGPATETSGTAETTTKETSIEMVTEKTTSGDATVEKTATASSTTAMPPTTLKTSFITTAPATSSSITEDDDTFTGPWPCVNYGGPRVSSGYCTCSTTIAGETFFTSAPHMSGGRCDKYHEYPGTSTLKTSDAAAPAPDPTPFTLTLDNGGILAYTDQAEHLGKYPGGTYTYTLGKGEPSTIRPGDPVQTASNNNGHTFCGGLDFACDRAARRFKDDVIYTQFTKYYDYIEDGPLVLLPFVESGCTVEYSCKDWSKGGLLGSQIKQAWNNLRAKTDVSTCGVSYLNNGCFIKADYCANCYDEDKSTYRIPG